MDSRMSLLFALAFPWSGAAMCGRQTSKMSRRVLLHGRHSCVIPFPLGCESTL